MKKVGIITNYHLNRNYGGLLQAYALQKAIERYGVEATQVSFIRKYSQTLSRRFAKNEYQAN